jgi:hypothetical protein
MLFSYLLFHFHFHFHVTLLLGALIYHLGAKIRSSSTFGQTLHIWLVHLGTQINQTYSQLLVAMPGHSHTFCTTTKSSKWMGIDRVFQKTWCVFAVFEKTDVLKDEGTYLAKDVMSLEKMGLLHLLRLAKDTKDKPVVSLMP